MAKAINWLTEAEAAMKVQRSPKTLRRNVKSGKWNVAFSAINGRRFFYSERDIERLILDYSNTL